MKWVMIVLVVLTCITAIMQVFIEFSRYKKSAAGMQNALQDMEEKIEAFKKKHVAKDHEMDQFKEQYHAYFVKKQAEERQGKS